MSHDVDAIYDQGVFRRLAPLVLPDDIRVHLRIEQESEETPATAPLVHVGSPRLVHSEQAPDFHMKVSDSPDCRPRL
jgi:predicted DNA-binding antitoxin AbrB/MazE fold protein